MTAGHRLKPVPEITIQKGAEPREARVYTWGDYNTEKQEYIRTHPNATKEQIEKESLRIAFEMGL